MTEESNKKLRISIGYTLPEKKLDKLTTQSFITHAKDQGIDLIHVDLNQPILKQPPLDCLIHKPYAENWIPQLLEFQANHPDVLIIDSPFKIERVNDRVSMLDFIPTIKLPPSSTTSEKPYTLGIPPQMLLLQENKDCNISLQFPVVAKPLVADGTPESHQLTLVFNSTGLQKVKQKAPLVLQEFVNHGGVMFKVYVAGKHVKCVQRNSLPDFDPSNFTVDQLQEGVFPFTRVSNLPSACTDSSEQTVSMPPWDFVHSLATAVREATQLHLFNFDLIRDASESGGNRYLIIDINYFPGYEKLQGYEAMLTDFFLDVVPKHDTI